jgi:hypothetical protein
MNEKFYNCVTALFFNLNWVQKWTAMALFLTLFDRFKNHIFYERKRMKKFALFLTDVKNFYLMYSNDKKTDTNLIYGECNKNASDVARL